ncbi:hypothetical protein P153DRAFT_384141 [Dothidotthia symphoricarpi CBS 119687]|uniref:Uncharacterized protein n=1 Tax=Dothidotthia symphoricarpi CBS 119687 TaxID=1392245 RepID=A0A6A6AJ39_9PLEO|nr:uncharacterized protein P153DRAFT_384141 [Dothidotthia symphoricarpi CBS 119687]KAF2130927.1 hypothetical protein P153DRAFT_384141 [Dothidotthia symphoricarpi CBS 119687]
MVRIPNAVRHLPQRLPIATLNTPGSKRVSRPGVFDSATNLGERGTLVRPALKLSDVFSQQRSLYSDSEDTGHVPFTNWPEEIVFNPYPPPGYVFTPYTNPRGEKIVLSPCHPPPGYVFVPSGNHFVTRTCRKLAQNLYVVCRPQTWKGSPMQIGLYVPGGVFQQAASAFMAKRARMEERLWQDLDKSYPTIPPDDKNKIHSYVVSQFPTQAGGWFPVDNGTTVFVYVRDQYTQFKSLDLSRKGRDTEAIAQAHRRAREILASWRAEDSGEEESSKNKGEGSGP